MLSEAVFEHISALNYYPATGELKIVLVNPHCMVILQIERLNMSSTTSERGSYYAHRSSLEERGYFLCVLAAYFDYIE